MVNKIVNILKSESSIKGQEKEYISVAKKINTLFRYNSNSVRIAFWVGLMVGLLIMFIAFYIVFL